MTSPSQTTFTIDNTSPLLQYQAGQWIEGSLADDPKAVKYFGNLTFTLSTAFGASMVFTFNGTSLTIGGAKRGNHGPYSVKLDGKTTVGNGFADPDVFQTPLFETSGLQQGLHTVTISNQAVTNAAHFLDIDFVRWNSTVRGEQTKMVEDTDPSFSYQPPSAWTTDISGYQGFSGSNGHVSSAANAFTTLTFQGDAIQLMGAVGPDHGSYTVSVDGGTTQTFNATKSKFQAQQVLYHADTLGPGQHTLKIANAQGNGVLSVDSATITEFTPPEPAVAPGAIAGIVVGAVVALGLILVGVIFWRKKRKGWQSEAERGGLGLDPSAASPINAMRQTLPPQYEPTAYPQSFVSPNMKQAPTPSLATTSLYSSTGGRSLHELRDAAAAYPQYNNPMPLPPPNDNYPQYNNPMALPANDSYPTFNYAESSAGSTDVSSNGGAGGFVPRTRTSSKGAHVAIPAASQQLLVDHIPVDELRAQRMQVPGREQDFGPVPQRPPETPRLPPDYLQAVEPFDAGPPRPF